MTATLAPQHDPADREAMLQEIYTSLRQGQRPLATWAGGRLAVSAVPGAGKSTGMAAAAAITIARHQLHLNKQLVLVTFTRSAAANLKAKVRGHLKRLKLPQTSFTVSTLHGLALTIATRNPELSNLSLDSLTLVSPAQNHRLIRSAVEQWIVANPALYQRLLEGAQVDGEETEILRRQSVLRTEVLPSLADTVIREAKSSGLRPAQVMELAQFLDHRYAEDPGDYDILAIAAGLYGRYQALMQERSLIDYDDMILAALRTLADPATRRFWQARVFAVFEDEAQDSSPLQTRLLTLLAGHPDDPDAEPNLVRVGDPNQAINSTFTPADPVFFNQFCEICRRQGGLVTMDQAGRSTAIIMEAANRLLNWANRTQAIGDIVPFRDQAIHPVPPDDPQPNANPAALGAGLEVHTPPTIQDTVRLIAQRVQGAFTENPELSFAILVREGRQGQYIAQRLRDAEEVGVDLAALGLLIYDVGDQDRQTQVPEDMLALMRFIDRPHSPDTLKEALRVLVDRQRVPTQDLNLLAQAPEQFLYPGPLDTPPTPPPPAPPAATVRACSAPDWNCRPTACFPFWVSPWATTKANWPPPTSWPPASVSKFAKTTPSPPPSKSCKRSSAPNVSRRWKPRIPTRSTPAPAKSPSSPCTRPRGWIGTWCFCPSCTRKPFLANCGCRPKPSSSAIFPFLK